MNKIIKIFTVLLVTIICGSNAFGYSIDNAISDCGINKSAISISIRDVNSGKAVYQLHEKRPMVPASTLKLVTYAASLDTLGKDFKFKTDLYKTTNNELYLKLAADPFLTSKDLDTLIDKAEQKKISEPKKFYIDDFVIDSNEWGEGWQWDDDLNILMPKFSSYNIDKNLLEITIEPSAKGAPAQIYLTTFYPLTFINLVTTGDTNDVELSRTNFISPNVITAKGSVKKQFSMQIPTNNPKRYFLLRLEDSIREHHLEYYGNFQQGKLPKQNIYLVGSIEHDLSLATEAILKKSSNFAAETLFKIAGGKFVNNTGSIDHSKQMLDAYLEKKQLNSADIKVVDGSGVSKNNLMTSDFMTNFLVKEANNKILIDNLPQPSEGTLENRMLYFKGNLRAKTGTVSNVSALAGYISTQKGNKLAFDIMIDDSKSTPADKKMLEEYILRAVYSNY